MPPAVYDGVDLKRCFALRSLRYADQSSTRVHVRNDPITVIGLLPEQRIKLQPPYERRDTDGAITVARQQNKADRTAEGVCQRQDFGGPTAFGLPCSLTESPPFEPCPER